MRTILLASCIAFAMTTALGACKKKPKDKAKDDPAAMKAGPMDTMDTMASMMAPDRKPADRKPADTKPADRKPADMKPADMGAADMGAADMGAAGGAGKAGAKVLVGAFKTFSMPDPGDQWNCQNRSVPRQRSALIKCKPKAPGKLFFVMVKGYDFTPEKGGTDLKKIFHETYLKNYKKMFTDVKIKVEKKVEVAGHKGYTMTITAKHKAVGPIVTTDTAFPAGTRMFMITFSGNAERYKALEPEAQKMVQGFKVLKTK